MAAQAERDGGGFRIRPATADDLPAIRSVLADVRREYGVHQDCGSKDPDLDDLNGNYFARGGRFEVIEDSSGRIVGCAGLRPHDARRVELCKMYIRANARGQGLGRQLLENMLAAARRGGFAEVWLETNSVLTAAKTLYAKYGFRPVEAADLLPKCDEAYLLRLGAGQADDRPVA